MGRRLNAKPKKGFALKSYILIYSYRRKLYRLDSPSLFHALSPSSRAQALQLTRSSSLLALISRMLEVVLFHKIMYPIT